MSRLRSRCRREDGSFGGAVQFGLLGIVAGCLLGIIIAPLIERVVICNADAWLSGGPCSGPAIGLAILTIPLGMLFGAIIGVVVGARMPRLDDRSPPHLIYTRGTGLAIAGGLAIELGVYIRWRMLIFPPGEYVCCGDALTHRAEAWAMVGGFIVLTGAAWRVFRPAAFIPSLLVGTGVAVAVIGVVWGMVDLLEAPAGAERHVFLGYWISMAGTGLAAAGWAVDRQRATRQPSTRPAG